MTFRGIEKKVREKKAANTAFFSASLCHEQAAAGSRQVMGG
jgi:hypothetical protein